MHCPMQQVVQLKWLAHNQLIPRGSIRKLTHWAQSCRIGCAAPRRDSGYTSAPLVKCSAA